MKKDENIYQQEIIDYCEEAVKESKKLCDQILDNYIGNLEQKEVLKELSRMVDIDNQIKEKMKDLNFDDNKSAYKLLDVVDELLKQKFKILEFLDNINEKELV